jgi:DNA invertase Pin-like site-specific DNA recombinase
MSSEKIGPQHRARKAMLYIRQSSTHQVLHNRESQALQYAIRDRLTQLGWSEIEVVDEDLGRSAGRLRAHGRRGVPRQSRRGGRAGGFALRA